jgi:hypothetical protein
MKSQSLQKKKTEKIHCGRTDGQRPRNEKSIDRPCCIAPHTAENEIRKGYRKWGRERDELKPAGIFF